MKRWEDTGLFHSWLPSASARKISERQKLFFLFPISRAIPGFPGGSIIYQTHHDHPLPGDPILNSASGGYRLVWLRNRWLPLVSLGFSIISPENPSMLSGKGPWF